MTLSTHYHAVVWIDHHEARVIQFSPDQADEVVVHPADPPRHLHGKAGSPSGTHITDEPEFYKGVAGSLATAKAILVAGPSTAKTEFIKYLHKHAPAVLAHVTHIETMDKVTDKELLAEGRRYFKAEDHMQPQRG